MKKQLFGAFLVTALLTTCAQAVVTTWTGDNSLYWGDPGNWSTGQLPGSGDIASLVGGDGFIGIGPSPTVIDGDVPTIESLFLGAYDHGEVVHTAGTLEVNSSTTSVALIGAFGHLGEYHMQGDNSKLTVSGSALMVGAFNGFGEFRQTAGFVTTDYLSVGEHTNSTGNYHVACNNSCDNSPALVVNDAKIGTGATGLFSAATGTITIKDRLRMGHKNGNGFVIYGGADFNFEESASLEINPGSRFEQYGGSLGFGIERFEINYPQGTPIPASGQVGLRSTPIHAIYSHSGSEIGSFSDADVQITPSRDFPGVNTTPKPFRILDAPSSADPFGSMTIGMDSNDGGLQIIVEDDAFVETLSLTAGVDYSATNPNGSMLFFANGGSYKALLPGDANLDGIVNDDDGTIWATNFGNTGASATWATGDFDGNRVVDQFDGLILGSYYGQGPVTPTTVVPEPSAAHLLGLCVLGPIVILRRKRRR